MVVEIKDVMLTKNQATSDVIVVAGCSSVYVVASLIRVPVGWIIPIVVTVLFCYWGFGLRRRSHTWRDYGLRSDNFVAAGLPIGCFTFVGGVVIVGWAIFSGNSLARPELLILLLIYPLWGFVQQLIFQGLLHRGLLVIAPSRSIALILNSAAFASVHISDWRVLVLTFIAGLFWSWFYQRQPNIWALGLSHGVLAALTYPLLLADNPLERAF